MTLFDTIGALLEAGVRFVVVGGVAAVAHGSVRVTVDLDICYDTAPENREALARLLAGWRAYPRGIDPGLPFRMDARTLANAEILTLATDAGPIGVFHRVAGVGDYAACLALGEEVSAEGLRFIVLGLSALIASKRAAGRPRDLEALRELEALEELRHHERE